MIRLLATWLLCLAAVLGSAAVAADAGRLPGFGDGRAFGNPSAEAQARIAVAPAAADGSHAVAIVFAIAPEWHLYWTNPGDSGLAPTATWTLPAGWRADPLAFPVPERLVIGGLVSFAYHDRLVLTTTLHPPAPGVPLSGSVALDWLVCKEACLPGSATLAVAGPGDPAAERIIAAARAAQPSPPPASLRLAAEPVAGGVRLHVDAVGLPATAALLPADAGFVLEPAPAFTAAPTGGAFDLRLAAGASPPERLRGILVGASAAPGVAVDVTVAAPAAGAAPASGPAQPAPVLGLWGAIAAGLLGGLILNLMPCVLPVLALKALSFARLREAGGSLLGAGLGFAAGVIATYLALAAVLLAVRAAGASLGWGFQLQEPWLVLALAALFILIAANLAGVFEVGLAASRIDARRGGSFLNGVLTTLVATPCGAPFASAALGQALAAPAIEAVAIFAALGVGLAAPMVAIALVPGAARLLPRPGAWMEDLKHVLAIPMLGAAGWMLWTAAALLGAEAAFLILVVMVPLVALAAWAYGRFQRGARWALVLALLAGAGAGAVGWRTLDRAPPPGPAEAAPTWEAWSPERERALLAAGAPYFVDYTAAWCLTCQVNKRTTLNDPAVVQAMAERGMVRLVADFTARDGRIAAALAALGRGSVPTYVIHAGDGRPRLLPDLLTPGIVLDALPPKGTP